MHHASCTCLGTNRKLFRIIGARSRATGRFPATTYLSDASGIFPIRDTLSSAASSTWRRCVATCSAVAQLTAGTRPRTRCTQSPWSHVRDFQLRPRAFASHIRSGLEAFSQHSFQHLPDSNDTRNINSQHEEDILSSDKGTRSTRGVNHGRDMSCLLCRSLSLPRRRPRGLVEGENGSCHRHRYVSSML
jgi:hypothetical protein